MTLKGEYYQYAFNAFDKWFSSFIIGMPFCKWKMIQDIEQNMIYNLSSRQCWYRRFMSLYKCIKRWKKIATDHENIVLSPIHLKISYLYQSGLRRFPNENKTKT